jgi:hypothetical protein
MLLRNIYYKKNYLRHDRTENDIREYFQGRNDKGRMNARSEDAHYTSLIGNLRSQLAILADKIKPKVYEYEFLKE